MREGNCAVRALILYRRRRFINHLLTYVLTYLLKVFLGKTLPSLCSLAALFTLNVSFNAPFTRPPAQTVKFTTRSWVSFDINRFESDLAASDLGTTDSTDVHQLFEMYDTTLRMLLDKHAPQRSCSSSTATVAVVRRRLSTGEERSAPS